MFKQKRRLEEKKDQAAKAEKQAMRQFKIPKMSQT